MSRYFQVGERVLWNPSTGVAELFVSTAEMLAATQGMPSGIGPVVADEHQVDLDAFAGLTDALVRRYLSSTHPILRSLLEGFIGTALALVQRAGRLPPALGEELRPADERDAERLRILGEECARAMPE